MRVLDSFSVIHATAYSFVGLQTLYLATHFPQIYWNTACLIVDSGSLNTDGGSTDYAKVATAINKIRALNISISPPNINTSDFGFIPDEKNNTILFGLKALSNVGDDVVVQIINNRPYTSLYDVISKLHLNKQTMIALIKSGALDDFGERKQIMEQYLWEVCDKKKNLNLQNLNSLLTYHLLPIDGQYQMAYRVYNFNKYLKLVCANQKVDNRAFDFLTEINCEYLIHDDMTYVPSEWKRVYDKYMDLYRLYIATNKQILLTQLNQAIFNAEWNKYAQGSYSKWEMETICFYYHQHELANVNYNKYGISNYFQLSEEPIVDCEYHIRGKDIKLFKLTKICGTVLSKNKTKGTIKLLTTDGVVDVRFGKEYFSLFDRTIKMPNDKGVMAIAERSWFERGSLIMIQGMRRGDQFMAKKYKSSNGHQLYKILEVEENGDILLQTERITNGENV